MLSLAGESDAFAASEAATAAEGVAVVGPGVATAERVDERGVRRLAYTRHATRLVGRGSPDAPGARAVAERAIDGQDATGSMTERAIDGQDATGSTAERAIDGQDATDSITERAVDSQNATGSIAVRATAGRGVDAPTQAAERAAGDALVEAGFTVDLDDPDRVFRVVFTTEECYAGWEVAVSERGYGARAPTDRPFFQPGSMDPLDARACANLAGAGEGRTIVDPMCGTGGTLIEAGLAGSRVIGIDRQRKMTRGTRENLRAYLDDGAVVRGDATRLPLAGDAADGVVFDAPYGRQSKIAGHDLRSLVAGALGEAARIAPRGVLVADRRWESAAEAAGWRVGRVFERRVHRSLVRHVHLLDRV